MNRSDPFHVWWLSIHRHPPQTSLQRSVFRESRSAWNRSREVTEQQMADELRHLEARNRRLEACLVAAADGVPIVGCPNCGAPDVDLDGSGLLVCPRDPSCYCLHPSSGPDQQGPGDGLV